MAEQPTSADAPRMVYPPNMPLPPPAEQQPLAAAEQQPATYDPPRAESALLESLVAVCAFLQARVQEGSRRGSTSHTPVDVLAPVMRHISIIRGAAQNSELLRTIADFALLDPVTGAWTQRSRRTVSDWIFWRPGIRRLRLITTAHSWARQTAAPRSPP